MPGFVVDCRVRLHYPAMAEIGQDPGPLSGPDATRQASPPELERVGGRGGTPVPAKAATDASRPPSWSAERTGCLPKPVRAMPNWSRPRRCARLNASVTLTDFIGNARTGESGVETEKGWERRKVGNSATVTESHPCGGAWCGGVARSWSINLAAGGTPQRSRPKPANPVPTAHPTPFHLSRKAMQRRRRRHRQLPVPGRRPACRRSRCPRVAVRSKGLTRNCR
jgi:hypothetical protein